MAIWGYELLMPGRPSRTAQRDIMQALGVDVGKFGRLWSDKIDKAKRHATAGQTQLTGRNDLILAVQAGDTVIVADPMCLGVSPKDAEWFLGRMAQTGVRVLVNGDMFKIDPGGSTADVVGEFARRLNNFNAAKSRGRV